MTPSAVRRQCADQSYDQLTRLCLLYRIFQSMRFGVLLSPLRPKMNPCRPCCAGHAEARYPDQEGSCDRLASFMGVAADSEMSDVERGALCMCT